MLRDPDQPATLEDAQREHGVVCLTLSAADSEHGGKLLHKRERWVGQINKVEFARAKHKIIFYYNDVWGWVGGQQHSREIPANFKCTIKCATRCTPACS